jgi:predicted NAD/FAD-binding protein
MKRIAVVGAGISGLAAAYFLSRRHHVWLFEKDARLGGHTNTVFISRTGNREPRTESPDPRTPNSEQSALALDTGFLVHNDRTYPNLVRLFDELGVETRPSDMCFAVSCRRTGLEYSSRGARGFFAERRNLFRRAHLRLLREILRFNREAPALLRQPDAGRLTLGEFLESRRFGDEFTHHYLFPMASAIWSSSIDSIRSFPALTLIRFFANHGMLGITTHPKWKVVRGGSCTYIPKLTAPLGGRVIRDAAIQGIARTERAVTVSFFDRPPMLFDEVVFACHGDQVLPLLSDPTDRERDILGRFRTTANAAWLHTDDRMLPTRADARASWNYSLGDAGRPPTVTYHLNRLQGLRAADQYCVTLNPNGSIDERRVLKKVVYAHPLYTRDAIRSQAQWREVSGLNRTHYCGAYWFYGFHEDGLNSALRVARHLGVDW